MVLPSSVTPHGNTFLDMPNSVPIGMILNPVKFTRNIHHHYPPQSELQSLTVALVDQRFSIRQTMHIYRKNVITHPTNAKDEL